MCRKLVLIAAALTVAHSAYAAEPLAVVPLTPYVGELRTIPVRIGEAQYPFLFDTAGGATCVTVEMAEEIGCDPWGRASGFRLSGERVEFQWCGDEAIEVGGVSLGVELSVFDLMSLLGNAPPLGGLASVHTFAEQPFTLDLDGNVLILESEASLRERVRSARQLSGRYAHQAGGASLDPFVEVNAEVGTLWMELDSGNLGRTILAPHAGGQLGLASTGESVASLDVVGLGPVSLQLRFVESCIYDGVLGVELFRGRTFTFDPEAGRIWCADR
jgi:hypothetical protein